MNDIKTKNKIRYVRLYIRSLHTVVMYFQGLFLFSFLFQPGVSSDEYFTHGEDIMGRVFPSVCSAGVAKRAVCLLPFILSSMTLQKVFFKFYSGDSRAYAPRSDMQTSMRKTKSETNLHKRVRNDGAVTKQRTDEHCVVKSGTPAGNKFFFIWFVGAFFIGVNKKRKEIAALNGTWSGC